MIEQYDEAELISARMAASLYSLEERGLIQPECKHIVGEWQDYEQGGLIGDGCSVETYKSIASEWFKFCPRCGVALPDLGLPTY